MSATYELDKEGKLKDLVSELIGLSQELAQETRGETFDWALDSLRDIKRRARELGVRW